MALGCAHGTGLMAEPVRKWLGGRKFLAPVFVGGRRLIRGGAVLSFYFDVDSVPWSE